MTKQEKTEANELVAKFMGFTLVTPKMRKHPEAWSHSYWEKNDEIKGRIVLSHLDYNSSWNSLISVVKELKEISSVTYAYKGSDIESALLSLNITKLFTAVVELIKYHNEREADR